MKKILSVKIYRSHSFGSTRPDKEISIDEAVEMRLGFLVGEDTLGTIKGRQQNAEELLTRAIEAIAVGDAWSQQMKIRHILGETLFVIENKP